MFLTRYLSWLFRGWLLFVFRRITRLFTRGPRHILQEDSEISQAKRPTPEEPQPAIFPVIRWIPLDIIDEILDNLATDPSFKLTLRSCSLVSKSWVTPCQRHLFRTLSFDLKHTFRWLETFPVQVQSPAHHVRNLSLSLDGHYYAPDEFLKRIHGFINVQKMAVLHDGGSKLWWMLSSRGLPQSVTSLTINLTDSITALQIREFLVQLPNLNDLSLSGSSRIMDKDRLQGIGAHLRGKLCGRLHLQWLPDMHVVDMLLDIPTGLHFTEVNISAMHDCLPSIIRLVEACGTTLVKLSCSIDDFGGRRAPDNSVDFAKLPNLEDATFLVRCTGGNLAWFPTALSTLKLETSPRLSIIRFDFTGRSRRHTSREMVEQLGNYFRLIEDELTRIEREFMGMVRVIVHWLPGFKH